MNHLRVFSWSCPEDFVDLKGPRFAEDRYRFRFGFQKLLKVLVISRIRVGAPCHSEGGNMRERVFV